MLSIKRHQVTEDETIVEVEVPRAGVQVDDPETYVRILNGIVRDCEFNDGFARGWRNQVILDMTVSSYLLGLEPEYVLDLLTEHNIIMESRDDESTYGRMNRMLDYTNRFSYDYMLDPEAYLTLAECYPGHAATVKFVLAD